VSYVFKQAITKSAVDLRGLGRRQTLVLVDGRRMPRSISDSDFDQPDLNGIPLNAIERIETLTGTAGGIYGPDALGGVLNVILRRDYEGADLQVTSGITSRGDARSLRLDGRIGISLNGGRTNLMVVAAHRMSEPLLAGQRNFDLRARQRQFANDPTDYVSRRETSNAVSVFSQSGRDLVLDETSGGGSLGASFTYLPVGFTGTREQAVALLRANAGKIQLDLPRDHSGAFRSLLSTAEVTSGVVNARHRISDGAEVYIDGLLYRNRGAFQNGLASLIPTTSADSPSNPFTERVFYRYPLPAMEDTSRTQDTGRLSAGLILGLARRWSAAADYSIGFSREHVTDGGLELPATYMNALQTGKIGFGGLPPLDPLGDWADLQDAASQYLRLDESSLLRRNRFSAASLRLGGPVLRSRAGAVTLTLLAERRRERSEPSRGTTTGREAMIYSDDFEQVVSSGYAELRAPLADASSRFLPGLELQVAGRFDHSTTSFRRRSSIRLGQALEPLLKVGRNGFNYTLGARFHPLPPLMLRASLATGELYPTVQQLTPLNHFRSFRAVSVAGPSDPRRGGEPIGGGELVSFVGRGSPAIKSELGRTISVGAIFNASGQEGPRVSVDYSRIDKRREVSPFFGSTADLLADEPAFSGRVTRAPPTEADAAQGFTAGRVTEIDLTPVNEGRTIVESVDVEFDWRMPLRGGSELEIYGSGTWQPRLSQRKGNGQPWLKRAGAYDGPLRWRGNLGAQWHRGPLSMGVNVQVFDGYRVTYANVRPQEILLIDNAQTVRYQGSDQIPGQAYVDLTLSRRFRLSGQAGPVRAVDVRFGVQNVLDKKPPIVADEFDVPYSTYGDPRLRRFELALSAGL
jgi:outer membrane receptor protein involved in Fe transport